MKCPKCDFDIDEKMLVCPNCKKVLKLVCPKCNTINKENTCRKCGFSIMTKCHECGKINQTIKGTCAKCGFSTYSSVAIASSNIDEFACLSIEFPNVDELKAALGSTKLFEKFKLNLDRLVSDYVKSLELTREIIDGAYVVKFNKDVSFSVSAKNAIKSAIELQNLITGLNFKLYKAKDLCLQSNVAVLKRNINTKPEDFKSGFDIKLIYQNTKELKLLNNLQIITDSQIYEVLCDDYDLKSLSSTFVKNQMVTFFELNIKKYVKIPVQEEESEDLGLSQLPVFEEQDLQEQGDMYNIDAINFDELKFNFVNTESINVVSQILHKIQENPLNIISVKAAKEFVPVTEDLVTKIEKLKKFKNVFRVTCHDGLKYEPYGFFRELISNICNFSKSSKNYHLHHFEMFEAVDPSKYINNLINAKERENSSPEEVRYLLFDIFFNIFSSIQGSMIYIEDFDKIDDSSYEILKLFFEKFEEFKISYVIVADRAFSLHKNSHYLLSNNFYTEIIVKPTPFKEIVAPHAKKYAEILNGYYIEKIAKNCKGSVLYFNQAISYLVENHSLAIADDGALSVADLKNVFVPTTLDALVVKRMNLLSKDKNAGKLFAMFLLIGPRIDFGTIKLLGIPDETVELQKLIDKKYIYISGESAFINNYNLYMTNFLLTASKEFKQILAQELLDKIFEPDVPSSLEPLLYSFLEKKNEEFLAWQNLSKLNSSMGDFSAYLNCSNKLLKLADETPELADEDYKSEVYENISNLMNKYSPEKLHNIVETILDNLQKSTDSEKLVELCNKMLQGYLVTGNYHSALGAIRRIVSSFPNLSINPESETFNIAFFFISLMKIEILFSLGNYKDCIEATEEILEVINLENLDKLKPSHLSQEKFEDVIFDAMCFAALAKVVLLSDVESFINLIQLKMGRVPEIFDLFVLLQNVIRGTKIDNLPEFGFGEDRFSKVLISIVAAFNDNQDDYKKFASNIHQAKISAKIHRLFQIELTCDLLIGYSYFKLENYKKASLIYSNVLETSEKNSLKSIAQLALYLISLLKFEENNLSSALGITNNAIIQLEKDENSSEFLFFLYRVLLARILAAQNEIESATLCLNNAQFLKEKYGLNFDINFDLMVDEPLGEPKEVPIGELHEETQVETPEAIQEETQNIDNM